MSAPLLSARALVAGWAAPATAPLDLTLSAGEVLGLRGPNGVGKSTVLAALAGTARRFAGTAERAPGVRLAFQPQAAVPIEGLPLTGRELLALTGAGAAGLPAWLAPHLDRRLDSLSGGQRHYLALWAVLGAPAEVLFLDEPTNHLDAAGIAHLGETVRQRVAAGGAVLVVSHDADFLAAVCDRTLDVLPAEGASHVG